MFHSIVRLLAVTLMLALLFKGSASAAPLAAFDFEAGIPITATTYGNVDVVSEIGKGGLHLPCYEGNFCLRVAPGQGPRNHDAGIMLVLPDVQTGDIISFAYVVIPEINDDFTGFSLTGPGFFDWKTLTPANHWTHFSYIVPDLSSGGPSLMAMTPTDWTVTLWVENTIGDSNRTTLWGDDLSIVRRVPEPASILLFGCALISLGIAYRKQP